MTVLHVGSWSSRCGGCGQSCDPGSLTHDRLLGYGPQNGQPGCGETFTAVSSDYVDEVSIAATKRMRPDLPFVGYDHQQMKGTEHDERSQ